MNKQLPERPNLDQLKKQAKDLLDDIRANRPEAVARVPQNELAGFALADAQRILAREYGFPSWTKLKERVELSGPALAARTLIRAALHGDAAQVTAMLQAYPRLSRADIQIAAALGDATGVRDWLAHDPALATKSAEERHWTPLLSACVGRVGGDDASRADCVRQLLAAGANANDHWTDAAYPDAKLPALYGATGINNYPQVARVLLAAGANPNDGESIYHAAEHNHVACLEALLEGGADLGQRNEQWKNTPLYFLLGHAPTTHQAQAARAGIAWLLDHGADPNVTAYEVAEVPLFPAIRNGWDVGLIRHFLAKGANPDARRADGLSLHRQASRLGRGDIARLLADHGAAVETSPEDEFLSAVASGDAITARRLIGANPRWRKSCARDLRQIVGEAAKRGEIGPIALAGELGAGVEQPNDKGETILHFAALHGQPAVVRQLIAIGSPINQRDSTYHAPPLGWCVHGSIHFRSAGADYPAVAEVLLAAGAEMIPFHREQMLPEMLAVFDRHQKP